MTIPASTSLTEVILPPAFASSNTSSEAPTAPAKAQKATPVWPSSPMDPKPIRMANVAPSEPPEEIPSMYGSASGFCTAACIMVPHRVRPAPMTIAINTRGKRIFQMISTKEPEVRS
ncbi:hypothetical protein D3C73_1382690 [compost metagenome]